MSEYTVSALICPELMWNRMVLRRSALKPGRPPGGGNVGTDVGRKGKAQTGRRCGEGTIDRRSNRHKRNGRISRTPREEGGHQVKKA